MKPIIFAAGDLNYCEKYGPTLKASAQEHGIDCLIVCNGKRVTTDRGRRNANAFRYVLLPDVLRQHLSVLVLDLDSIVRRPIEISDEVSIGFVPRPDTNDKYKKINGGCFYITDRMMDVAVELSNEMRDFPVWYYDQIVLWRISERLKDRAQFFGPELFSWDFHPQAAIWTGKGSVKFSPAWENEVRKYEHFGLDWIRP